MLKKLQDFDILFSRSPTALSNLLSVPLGKRFKKKVVIKAAREGIWVARILELSSDMSKLAKMPPTGKMQN